MGRAKTNVLYLAPLVNVLLALASISALKAEESNQHMRLQAFPEKFAREVNSTDKSTNAILSRNIDFTAPNYLIVRLKR